MYIRPPSSNVKHELNNNNNNSNKSSHSDVAQRFAGGRGP